MIHAGSSTSQTIFIPYCSLVQNCSLTCFLLFSDVFSFFLPLTECTLSSYQCQSTFWDGISYRIAYWRHPFCTSHHKGIWNTPAKIMWTWNSTFHLILTNRNWAPVIHCLNGNNNPKNTIIKCDWIIVAFTCLEMNPTNCTCLFIESVDKKLIGENPKRKKINLV